MDSYLWPLVLCRLYYDNNQAKKDIGEIEKIEKYSQLNVYAEIGSCFFFFFLFGVYVCVCVRACVCVCVHANHICVLLCIAL